jgi:hypothetical protein
VAEASHAVFLSYASQDAKAAQKICEALRSAGIEVYYPPCPKRGSLRINAKPSRFIDATAHALTPLDVDLLLQVVKRRDRWPPAPGACNAGLYFKGWPTKK